MWRKFQGTFDGQRCNVFNFIGTRPDVGGRNRSKISVVDEMGLHTVDVDGLESSAIPASILRMQNGVNGSHDQLVAVQPNQWGLLGLAQQNMNLLLNLF